MAASEKACEKARAELAEKIAEGDVDDEFQDADDGEGEHDQGNCKGWQDEYDDLKLEHADLRKKIKVSNSKITAEKGERAITENTARMQEFQTKLWSAQDSQEQLQKKGRQEPAARETTAGTS